MKKSKLPADVARAVAGAWKPTIKMGEYLMEMEKNKGGNPNLLTPHSGVGVEKTSTYEEIGISYNEASEAQTLADLSNEVKEKVVSGKKSKRGQ